MNEREKKERVGCLRVQSQIVESHTWSVMEAIEKAMLSLREQQDLLKGNALIAGNLLGARKCTSSTDQSVSQVFSSYDSMPNLSSPITYTRADLVNILVIAPRQKLSLATRSKKIDWHLRR